MISVAVSIIATKADALIELKNRNLHHEHEKLKSKALRAYNNPVSRKKAGRITPWLYIPEKEDFLA